MIYTNLTLLFLGILGILIHNLIKLNALNRELKGTFSFREYIRVERFSIAVSFCVVIAALFVKHEIQALENAGKWIGLGFLTLGYMGQSVVIVLMGRANKIIGGDKNEN